MRRKTLSAAAVIFSVTVVSSLTAQTPPGINRPVNEAALVRVRGTVHPLATAAAEIGRAPAELRMERVLLLLRRSPQQESELTHFLGDLQDPASPGFHHWLTPEQFGERFGPPQQDLDVVTAWLQSHGLQVGQIAKGRGTIEFSGTVAQVESALHTEIHRYMSGGVEHVANSTDIAIPAALEPAVSGVVSLNSFPHRSFAHVANPSVSPQDNIGGGHALAPYDFATIYDLLPLWSNGIDGTGQIIGIAGRSDIVLSDITTFRATFGLSVNNPNITLNGPDPGVIFDDESEADLDVQWSGAVAKGATVKYVVSKSTNASDGVNLSSAWLVNDNTASVLSLSYGDCEAYLGAAGNQFFNDLWAQASSQGMSVFVAAGDSGSAGCDQAQAIVSSFDVTAPAGQGLAVSGLASTPYNVAVGGTQFNDVLNSSAYWNSGNDPNQASALKYIPEVVWNQSSYSLSDTSSNSLYAGAGGVSSLYPTPVWQAGQGVPVGDPAAPGQHHRYLPDVSLNSSLVEGYRVYQAGTAETVGGTSAASPSMAGIMALINQYTGGRNGNPNVYFYSLAANAGSVFHDVTSGTNSVPCLAGTLNCITSSPPLGFLSAYNATAGFDLATGWGSVDAFAMAQNWIANGPSVPAISSLSPNPMTASASTRTLTIDGAGFRSGASVTVGATTFTGTQVTFAGPTRLQVTITQNAPANLAIQVTNPDQHSSNAVTLQVLAPPVAPVISSVSPNPIAGSDNPQLLTVTGGGFLGGLTLQVGSVSYSSADFQSFSATQIQVPLVLGTATRGLAIRVTNPDGTSSNSATLQVTGPIGQFVQQGNKLVGTGATGLAQQGSSVAVSSDGSTAIVGASRDNASVGAAWVYSRINGVWSQQGAKLVGTGSSGASQQGTSVAISGDGNTAVVGGPGDNTETGAVWIFTRANGVWTQQGAKLVSADINGAAQLGGSVGISADGNTVVAGGAFDNTNVGAAWAYTRSNGVWAQQGNKMVGNGAVGGAQQGTSVAISGDGNTIVVVGPDDNNFTSADWIFARTNGVWVQQGSKLTGAGETVALTNDGNTALIGDIGQAFVVPRVNGVWNASQAANITLIGTGTINVAISADGKTAILGAADYGLTGAAWVYKLTGGIWKQFGDRLIGADVTGTLAEGSAVALSSDGTTAIVGDPLDSGNTGAGWVFGLTPAPQITPGGVSNAAGTPLSMLARGALGALYGANLTPPGFTAQADQLPFPVSLGGTSVTVGGIPAPLYYVSSGQINFQVPFEVPAGSTASVVVTTNGAPSTSLTVGMADYALGVFGYYRTSSTFDPIITHLDGSLLGPNSPAVPNEIVVVYATGIGKLTNPPASGAGAPGGPLASAVDTPSATVGGLQAPVVFAGLTPGGVGLAQLDVQLPATFPSSPTGTLPLLIQFPGDSVAPVNLYVVSAAAGPLASR